MAYFARKRGLEAYKERRANKEVICFVCKEIIQKGETRFVTGVSNISLCKKCMCCWKIEGGLLAQISRYKNRAGRVPGNK